MIRFAWICGYLGETWYQVNSPDESPYEIVLRHTAPDAYALSIANGEDSRAEMQSATGLLRRYHPVPPRDGGTLWDYTVPPKVCDAFNAWRESEYQRLCAQAAVGGYARPDRPAPVRRGRFGQPVDPEARHG